VSIQTLEKVNLVPQADAPVSQIPVQSETAAVLSMIERAARDPAVDIDKLRQLMEMREKAELQASERAFNSAMRGAQAEMRPISADAENPQTRSRYATYAKLDRALRPIYTKHGFALSFDEADSPKPDHIRVLCYVSHDGGFTRTYRKDMPADGKGAKGGDVMTKTHATGAAASYGSRYLLKGIFNVAVGEDDRDGNTAPGSSGTITAEQAKEIKAKCDAVADGFDESFCNYFGIASISDLPATDYQRALTALKKKGV
jgi:hypothetical protein